MSKMSGRYDPAAEKEVRTWIQQLTGEDVPEGQFEVEKKLKDGIVLCKLMDKLFKESSDLPPKCKTVHTDHSTSEKPFKQMENIETFLKAAHAYGVPQNGLFACVDLYEGRNMPYVISAILQVGSEAQRNKFDGPSVGHKPIERKRRQFSRAKLRAGHTMIGLQSGTNKFASQKGMSFGSVRHVADIRCDDADQEGQGLLTQQAATNKYASQAGSRGFGSVRHISDIRADDCDPEGSSVLTQQMGSNKYASQKGMRGFGAVRHISDIKADDASAEGFAHLSLQSGTNKFASQTGMTCFGAQRHVSDIKVTEICEDDYDIVSDEEEEVVEQE